MPPCRRLGPKPIAHKEPSPKSRGRLPCPEGEATSSSKPTSSSCAVPAADRSPLGAVVSSLVASAPSSPPRFVDVSLSAGATYHHTSDQEGPHHSYEVTLANHGAPACSCMCPPLLTPRSMPHNEARRISTEAYSRVPRGRILRSCTSPLTHQPGPVSLTLCASLVGKKLREA